jgi:hypothetical protein
MKTVVNDTDYSWLAKDPDMFERSIYKENFFEDLIGDNPKAFVSDDVLEKLKGVKEVDLSTSIETKKNELTSEDKYVEPDSTTSRFSNLAPEMCQQMLDIIEKNRFVTQSDLFRLSQCEAALKTTMKGEK